MNKVLGGAPYGAKEARQGDVAKVGPTEAQIRLAAWADGVESDGGVPTSLYYRLFPQIIEARAIIARVSQ